MRCQAGDEGAFRELYNMHKQGTYRYLKSMIGESIAQDLNQDVWLIVYKKIHELMQPEKFNSWLYRITRYEALDYIRDSKKRTKLEKFYSNEQKSYIFDQKLENLFEETNDIDLQKAMETLLLKHREVLILNYYEGFTYEEIALITGTPIGTIRSRIYHAKLNIKKLLERENN